jgi:hypothetical protein
VSAAHEPAGAVEAAPTPGSPLKYLLIGLLLLGISVGVLVHLSRGHRTDPSSSLISRSLESRK